MTVAAIIAAEDERDMLAEAAGRPAVRRIVDSAWAGGALPIVVVADDPDGHVAAALAGTPARVVARGQTSPDEAIHGAVGVAREMVGQTDALLCWPATMTWVDPETVTSLIEGHGVWPATVLRPGFHGRAGWPVLIPVADLAASPDGGSPAGGDLPLRAEARERLRQIETGDPGSVHDRHVLLDDLAPYEGPPEPVGGPPPDWGAAAADQSAEL